MKKFSQFIVESGYGDRNNFPDQGMAAGNAARASSLPGTPLHQRSIYQGVSPDSLQKAWDAMTEPGKLLRQYTRMSATTPRTHAALMQLLLYMKGANELMRKAHDACVADWQQAGSPGLR